MPTLRAQAHAPWSASKVQTALRCPKLFHYRYVDKVSEPEVMPETRIGKAVHRAIELALTGTERAAAIAEGEKLLDTSDEGDRYRRICQNIESYQERIATFRATHSVRRQFIEYPMAVDAEGNPTGFHSKTAFFRGIVDAAYIYNSGQLALIDHKTGMRQPNVHIGQQLEAYSILASRCLRGIRTIRTGIHWITQGIVDWSPTMAPDHQDSPQWSGLQADVEAAALAVSDGPRPWESSWCQRCSYRSVCPEAQAYRFEPTDIEPEPGIA